MKRNVLYIIIASIIACFLLYVIERVLVVSYETKTLWKIIFFTAIPIIYWKFFKFPSIKTQFKKTFFLSILLSLVTFSVIWIGFLIFGSSVDFYGIREELILTESGYLLRGIYIIFGNSFLEEFFFRGFIFISLYKLGLKKLSYVYSSALFAIYHIAMIQSWFELWIIFIILAALFTVGIVFDYLCTRVSSFTGSWLVHISADLAIIIIGWIMFF